jgi:ABC-2 type transport system ATP-binding protein
MADRIAIIDHGRLLVLDTPEALKRGLGGEEILEVRVAEGQDESLESLAAAPPPGLEGVERVENSLRFKGTSLQALIPGLQEQLDRAGLDVLDLTVRRPTLEDVFISLTGRGLRE